MSGWRGACAMDPANGCRHPCGVDCCPYRTKPHPKAPADWALGIASKYWNGEMHATVSGRIYETAALLDAARSAERDKMQATVDYLKRQIADGLNALESVGVVSGRLDKVLEALSALGIDPPLAAQPNLLSVEDGER